MAVATAGVAGLASAATEAGTTATVGVAEARLGAVTGNVTDLAALSNTISFVLDQCEQYKLTL